MATTENKHTTDESQDGNKRGPGDNAVEGQSDLPMALTVSDVCHSGTETLRRVSRESECPPSDTNSATVVWSNNA